MPGRDRFPPRRQCPRAERAAAALSLLERAVLLLSAGYGLANAAIATELGISEARVERLLARGLSKFARAIEREGVRRAGAGSGRPARSTARLRRGDAKRRP